MNRSKSSKRKKVIRIWKSILLAGFIFFSGLYIYTKFYWTKVLSPSELTTLIEGIKKADPLPEKLYTLYDLQFPGRLSSNVSKQLLRDFFFLGFTLPPSGQIARYSRVYSATNSSKRRGRISEISLAWKIENKTSQIECLNWMAGEFNFLFRIRGIKEASKFYFQKDLFELNDRELAKMVLMFENPRWFNARRESSQKKVNDAVKVLLKKLEEIN